MSGSLAVVTIFGLMSYVPLVDAADTCPVDVGCHCLSSPGFGFQIDCSNLGLRSIPCDLPDYTTNLDLSGNTFTSIGADELAGLTLLNVLDLHSNNLTHINMYAFRDLPNLKRLYLQNNRLNITDDSVSLSPHTFKPLVNLEKLDITHNIQFISAYPNGMWEYVPKLEELYMNGIFATFGEGFTHLRHLNTLSFRTGECIIRSIHADTFAGLRFSPITKLDLEDCSIGAFEGRAFRNLPFLSWLSVAQNPLRSNVLNMAAGFQNTSLVHLDLNKTNLGDHVIPLIKNCLCGSKLKWLTVSSNTIYSLGGLMSRCFPDLEVFSFSDNCIMEHTQDYLDLGNMTSIRFLNMSQQNHYPLPPRLVRRHSGVYSGHLCERWEACPVSLPETLRIIDISGNGPHLPQVPELVFMNNNTLDRIVAVRTGLIDMTKPFYCRYRPILRELDLTNNSLRFLHQDLFAKCDWSSMLRLKIGGNTLAPILNTQGDRPFLKPLTGLQELDLSSNGIAQLPPEVFSGNAALEVLSLAGNIMSNMSASIKHMGDLRLLDLSNNRIPCLSPRTLAELQEVLQTSPSLKVNLGGNNIHCSCDCMHSIRWMYLHKELFMDLHTYSCIFDDNSIESFAEFKFVIQRLEGDCQSRWWAYGSLLASIVWVVVTIACSMLYRWRFSLEVMWYKPRGVDDEVPYEFDCFVCYNQHDRNWVQDELCKNLEDNDIDEFEGVPATNDTDRYKLCCHHRDFRIGMHIIDNISDAFSKSRTTLIALSNTALRGGWLLKEMHMAVQTAVERGTNSMLFVFLEPLQGHLVTPQLRRILNTYTCKRWYPNDPNKQVELWNSLRIAMKFPKRSI